MGTMKANRKFKEADDAVSAVIGVILMVAITVAIAATVYVYVSGMIGGTEDSSPAISWSVDKANDQITITKGSAGDAYAAAADNANLIFKAGGTSYYIDSSNELEASETGLKTDDILAGDVLTNFTSGTEYTIVWEPTNTVIGQFTP